MLNTGWPKDVTCAKGVVPTHRLCQPMLLPLQTMTPAQASMMMAHQEPTSMVSWLSSLVSLVWKPMPIVF